MATIDKPGSGRAGPGSDPERLLARRFLLGGLAHSSGGLRRYRVRRHESGPPLDLHLLELPAGDEAANARFQRGVAAARSMRHSAVQSLVEAGRLDADHVYALVSERGNQGLDALLERGPLPVSRAVAVLFDVAGALETLHRRGGSYGRLGIEHLSLTPLHGGADAVRLLPVSWLAAPGLGSDGSDSSPPEGDGAGAAGDLWQLGVIAAHMLTGSPPFSSDELAHMRAGGRAPAWRPLAGRGALGPVPEALEQLVRDLLDPAPERRPRSVYEVALLLQDQDDAVEEAPAIAPPMLLFTPVPPGQHPTPIPTRIGSAVAFDVIRDAAPPRRPSSVRPAPSRPRHGNTPRPRGTPARVPPVAARPEPIPTPVPRQPAAPGPPTLVEPDAFEDSTTEVTIAPRLERVPRGGPTRMSPTSLGILVTVLALASAALVPLLLTWLG
jgi:serine/threonine-protein kinase